MRHRAHQAELSLGHAESAFSVELLMRLRTEPPRSDETYGQAFATALTYALVHGYWDGLQDLHQTNLICTDAPGEINLEELDLNILELAKTAGRGLVTLPVQTAAHRIGEIYTAALPRTYRARHGIFYTPPSVAERLLDQATSAGVDWATSKVLDPACGGSAFLLPVAARMLKAMEKVDQAIVLKNLSVRLVGWELDPFASWLSRVFIEALCLPLSATTGRRPTPTIRTLDSLKEFENEEQFDLVVGNPPFGRVTLSPDMRQHFRRSLFGHANLYGLFTDLAVRLTRNNGVIALLTPASFLGGEYFKNLRRMLHEIAPPICLDFVASRKDVFAGVLQETVLATYRKAGKRGAANIELIHPGPDGSLSREKAGTFQLPAVRTAPWILPRHGTDKTLSRRLREFPSRLADWGYRVSTGPLVWNRHKSQLRDQPGPNCVPLIWAESITSEGRFEFRARKRNHKPFFALNASRDNWLKVDKTCLLLQRTTAKEQHRRLIAAQLPASLLREHGAVTVENHLNMVIPIVDEPSVSLDTLAALFSSAILDRSFRCISGSVAVSAYELESLPLPSSDTLAPLQELVVCSAPKADIDTACTDIFLGPGH